MVKIGFSHTTYKVQSYLIFIKKNKIPYLIFVNAIVKSHENFYTVKSNYCIYILNILRKSRIPIIKKFHIRRKARKAQRQEQFLTQLKRDPTIFEEVLNYLNTSFWLIMPSCSSIGIIRFTITRRIYIL